MQADPRARCQHRGTGEHGDGHAGGAAGRWSFGRTAGDDLGHKASVRRGLSGFQVSLQLMSRADSSAARQEPQL